MGPRSTTQPTIVPPHHSPWKDSGSVSGLYRTPVPERKPSNVANASQHTRKFTVSLAPPIKKEEHESASMQ